MSIKQQLVRILLRGMKEVYMDRIISDKLYLSLLYRRVLDKKMHWDNPCTFNEKLQRECREKMNIGILPD